MSETQTQQGSDDEEQVGIGAEAARQVVRRLRPHYAVMLRHLAGNYDDNAGGQP